MMEGQEDTTPRPSTPESLKPWVRCRCWYVAGRRLERLQGCTRMLRTLLPPTDTSTWYSRC